MIASAGLICSLPLAANATLVPIDDPVWGPNSLVLDNGTEFLDLKFTAFQSAAQVLSDPRFAGFSPWHGMLDPLLSQFFGTSISFATGRFLDPTLSAEFIDLF